LWRRHVHLRRWHIYLRRWLIDNGRGHIHVRLTGAIETAEPTSKDEESCNYSDDQDGKDTDYQPSRHA